MAGNQRTRKSHGGGEMKKLAIILAVCLWSGAAFAACTGSSPTWASTPDKASLTTCVGSAVDGDTINVAAGSATWSGALTVSGKKISIIGAGIGSTVITGNSFFVTTIASTNLTVPSIRISGFSFILTGNLMTFEATQGFRVDHVAFSQTSALNCVLSYGLGSSGPTGRNWGLFDHDTFSFCQQETLGGDFPNTGNSDNLSWSDADPTGTENIIDYETDLFINSDPSSNGYFNCFDSYMGGAYVVRFSTLSGCRFEGHGLQGDSSRGSRVKELYSNTICGNSPSVTLGSSTCPSPNVGNPGYSYEFQRGGVLHEMHNTIDGNWLHQELRIDTDRAEEDSIASQLPNTQFCDGTTQSTYLTTPGNLGGGTTTYPSPKTIIIDGAGTGGFPCRDGFGVGKDASTWAAGYSTTPPAQSVVPSYLWRNIQNGSEATTNIDCETPGDFLCNNNQANLMVVNKNFYQYNASNTGATGVGEGVLASRPATCTANAAGGITGVGYWATDQGSWNSSGAGGQGVLYTCNTTNTWTLTYTPLAYPHPFLGGTTTNPPAPRGFFFTKNESSPASVGGTR